MSTFRFQPPGNQGPAIPGIIGTSAAMQAVYALTRKVATSNASVLLLGETGSGKEVIASAVHRLSSRSSGPFVRVNCGALSESLLESELFGHVRGAFTGAVNNRTGRFEAAHTGAIFLDEINSTSLFLQVKLLRVLQEREFERVGDTSTIRVDTRVIAASNRDLWEEVNEGRFREDLYWRLNVVPIVIPPLRQRQEDIPALVAHFLNIYSEKNEKHVVHIQPEVLQLLQAHDWPGNVRELQNYVERAVAMAEGDEFTVELLPESVLGRPQRRGGRMRGGDIETLVYDVVQQGISAPPPEGEPEIGLHERIVSRVEKELIVQVMQQCNNVQTKAATRLGINRNTLRSKLQEYNLEEGKGE